VGFELIFVLDWYFHRERERERERERGEKGNCGRGENKKILGLGKK